MRAGFQRVFQPGQISAKAVLTGGAEFNHQPAYHQCNNAKQDDLSQFATCQEKQQTTQDENSHGRADVGFDSDQSTNGALDDGEWNQAQLGIMQKLPLAIQPDGQVDNRCDFCQ